MTRRITRMFIARKKLGWTQQRLAEWIGVTQPRISAWENGLADIPPYRADQIAEALGLAAEELAQDA